MFQQLLTIARNTFIESIRQPIFAVLILAFTLLLVLNPMISAYTLDDDNKQLIDMGLSALFVCGLLLAAFTATGVVSREVENKTVLTVVSKPVSRITFILGKYVGIASAIGVAYLALSAVFILTIRHKVLQTASEQFDGPVIAFGVLGLLGALLLAALGNYFYQWVFTSSFVLLFTLFEVIAMTLVLLIDKGWNFQSPLAEFAETGIMPHGQLVIGMLLVFQGVLLITAIATAVSTRLGQVMTLVICFAVFLLGIVNDYLRQLFPRSLVAEALGRVAPNIQFFWPADALTQGHTFTGGYLAWVAGYTALFILAMLALAVAMFQTREVG